MKSFPSLSGRGTDRQTDRVRERETETERYVTGNEFVGTGELCHRRYFPGNRKLFRIKAAVTNLGPISF